MGTQSDFISTTPSERYKAQRIAGAKFLIADGFALEEIPSMLRYPLDQLSGHLP